MYKGFKINHSENCPGITEYSGFNSLKKYCLDCLNYLLFISSSDWRKAEEIRKLLISYEKTKMKSLKSLKSLVIEKIIFLNIDLQELPQTLIKEIIEHISST